MSKPASQPNSKPSAAARQEKHITPQSDLNKHGGQSRKFAFGYYFDRRSGFSFRDLAEQYAPFLQEVYFPWPGLLSAREIKGDPVPLRKQLVDDMRFCRSKGMKLDLLANATCYGDKSFTSAQKDDFYADLGAMKEAGILPDIVTTTSPYLAVIAKKYNADFDCRASVNMRLNSTLAMEYVSDEFDSFYICRDLQRDLETVKLFSEWGRKNGKKICMLANSGCLRTCPWQTYHETLLSHDFLHTADELKYLSMPSTLCASVIPSGQYEEILRGTWIRPEDLRRYEPYISTFKLSTREADRPDLILEAYTSGSFDGNLLLLLDPNYTFFIRTKIFDNKSFPKEWSEGKIAGQCADNCTHCGKCTEVLNLIFKRDPKLPNYSTYTLTPQTIIKIPGK